MSANSLDPPLLERYDLLVVGGGIYGAAAAYEASRRGLSVLLAERDDFGSGSSSNSMKIIHGGLRYLQDYDLPRVVGSHRELRRLLGIAPHRIRPLRSEPALAGQGPLFRAKLRVGLGFYGLLSRFAGVGLSGAPRPPASRYPFWYDAIVVDTEKLLLDYLHTAVRLGGGRTTVRNYCAVEEYVHADGRVVAARVDPLGEIPVGAVVERRGTFRAHQPVVLALNLVVDPLRLTAAGDAVALRHPDDGRYVFAVPWNGRTLLGTYERSYAHDPREPLRFDPVWIGETLAWLGTADPELAALTRRSIRFVHAGLLPRDSPAAEGPSHVDRISVSADGRVRVLGAKYTMARAIASRAVDRAVPGRRAPGPPPALLDRDAAVREFTRETGEGEVVFAVEHERARTLADVLLRRIGIAASGYPDAAVISTVARGMQRCLGWSDEALDEQRRRFAAEPRFLGGPGSFPHSD